MTSVIDAEIPIGSGFGDLVLAPGHIQYGPLRLGDGTLASWGNLVGWRDLPQPQLADPPRPQSHGVYPGTVFGDALPVTFDSIVFGNTPAERDAALETIERYTPMDGVERPLVIDDGDGPWFRQARVIGRSNPVPSSWAHGAVELSIQFLCSDPRRYAVAAKTGTATLPVGSGGLTYPLDYSAAPGAGLQYGTFTTGGLTAVNDGSVATPLVAEFQGPLTNPVLATPAWSMGFTINLAAGETLVVDTGAGTVLLGDADRLYTITTDSDPLERCLLKPGATDLTLTAFAGSGQLTVTYHDARM